MVEKNHANADIKSTVNERACCRFLREERAKFGINVRVLYELGVNTPRQVAMHAQTLNQRYGPFLAELLSNEKCPCHDTPDPDTYGALVGAIMEGNKTGNGEKAMNAFLDQYIASRGMATNRNSGK